MRALLVVPEREQMTLGEARILGLSAQRYEQLAQLLGVATGGSITISTRNGAQSVSLALIDLQAALALLIEREAAHLSSMGVKLNPVAPEPRHDII